MALSHVTWAAFAEASSLPSQDGKYPAVESADGEYGEPGLLAQAALGLALRGLAGVEDRIHEMLRGEPTWMDRAALEVALAALGDPSYLKRQHFIFGSYTIGYAALRVIEMYGGEYGMEALVHGALEHSGRRCRPRRKPSSSA